MRVEKVLSRGQGKDAQVLLVLVSTLGSAPAGEDLWVAFGRTEPAPIIAAFPWEWIECARPLTTAELERLDPGREVGTPPFGLDTGGDRNYWLARFDFTDHPALHGWWFGWAQAQDGPEPEKLNVTAWRSRLKRGPDAKGVDTDIFEPLPGFVSAAVTLADVVAQPLFELGVLFVHGIGNHHVRETLVRWAEPIVKIWRDRGFEIDVRASRDPIVDRQRVARWVRWRQLRNRVPIDGISQVAEEYAAAEGSPGSRVTLTVSADVVCGTAIRTEETLFSDLTQGTPSSALLRVSTVHADAVLRESHVLFTEAYWSRESFPPTWSELRQWLTTAIPIGVWARMERLFETRPSEIGEFARAAVKARDAFELIRVTVSIALWLFQVAMLPTLYVAGALVIQLLLGTVSLVRLLPIPWLQRAIRAAVEALLGTLGQSYALQNSPIRRAAIVAAVTNNLNWLSQKCQRVVVLAHSQGAEVTRRVFLDSRRDNLAHWYTFGAGMTPLNMLHPRSLAKASSTWVVRANKVLLYTAATLLAALALDLIPGLHIGTWDLLAHAVRDVNWRTLVPGLMLFVSAVGLLARHNGPPLTLKMRASTLEKWSDFFGSEDPVPGGSFINRFGQLRKFRPSQHRIFNTRVAVLDHNRYWTNIEQFVAPIAMDLLHLMGAGGDKAREQGALDEAARRRDLRTWWNMVISVTALVACAISALWTAFGPAHRGVIWAEQARLAWSQGSGVLKRLPPFWHDGFVGTLLSDLWLPCLIVLGLAGWWGVMTWLGIRSRKALVRDLAAAARRSAP